MSMDSNNEKWYFVFCDNQVIAAFPEQEEAFLYANHMCFPGVWNVLPGEIPKNCIKKEKS